MKKRTYDEASLILNEIDTLETLLNIDAEGCSLCIKKYSELSLAPLWIALPDSLIPGIRNLAKERLAILKYQFEKL